MNNVVRIYGQVLNIWKSEDLRGRTIITQKEIAYTDYNIETGEIVGVGSEDFSYERYKKEVIIRFIHTWDGIKRMKNGHRWFGCKGIIRYNRSQRKEVLQYLKNKYKDSVVLQLR